MIDPGRTPRETAAQEALEEAGIEGEVGLEPVGTYTYGKWGGTCTVSVFLLAVTELLPVWPEQPYRERRSATVAEALEMLHVPQEKNPEAQVHVHPG